MSEHRKCMECGCYVDIGRYERVKLCISCRSIKRSGHNEVRQIFKELQKRNQHLPKEDWSSQNVKCNDNQIWKQ